MYSVYICVVLPSNKKANCIIVKLPANKQY